MQIEFIYVYIYIYIYIYILIFQLLFQYFLLTEYLLLLRVDYGMGMTLANAVCVPQYLRQYLTSKDIIYI